jgi:hypothetical protein
LSRQEARTKWILGFSAAVAARHQGRRVSIPSVRLGRLNELISDAFGPDERLAVVANYIEHCKDIGSPTVSLSARWARPSVVVSPLHATPGHARVIGALGRLRAVCGSPEEGILLQKRAFRILERNKRPTDTSFPLCEWLRLAGATDNVEELHEAERAMDSLGGGRRRFTFPDEVQPFVDLAHGVAHAHLRQAEIALRKLNAVLRSRTAPIWLRSSAARWWRILSGSMPTEVSALGDEYPLLAELDDAVSAKDSGRTRNALSALSKWPFGPFPHLIAAAARLRRAPGPYVSRFYPY